MVVGVGEVEFVIRSLKDTNQESKCYDLADARDEKDCVWMLTEGRLELEGKVVLDSVLMGNSLAKQSVVGRGQSQDSLKHEK